MMWPILDLLCWTRTEVFPGFHGLPQETAFFWDADVWAMGHGPWAMWATNNYMTSFCQTVWECSSMIVIIYIHVCMYNVHIYVYIYMYICISHIWSLFHSITMHYMSFLQWLFVLLIVVLTILVLWRRMHPFCAECSKTSQAGKHQWVSDRNTIRWVNRWMDFCGIPAKWRDRLVWHAKVT